MGVEIERGRKRRRQRERWREEGRGEELYSAFQITFESLVSKLYS